MMHNNNSSNNKTQKPFEKKKVKKPLKFLAHLGIDAIGHAIDAVYSICILSEIWSEEQHSYICTRETNERMAQ